jgi:hypothetical protein
MTTMTIVAVAEVAAMAAATVPITADGSAIRAATPKPHVSAGGTVIEADDEGGAGTTSAGPQDWMAMWICVE